MSGEVRAVPVPMTGEVIEARRTENTVRLGAGSGSLPYDLPVYIGVTRYVGGDPTGLLGWSLDIESISHACNIQIKIGRGNKPMVILLDGNEIGRVPKPDRKGTE